jgi:opacity protein-like surface antigen
MTISRVSMLVGAAIGLAALAGSPAKSVAADLGYGLKDSYAPPPPPLRRWYLKGTIGMHNHEVGEIWNSEYDTGKFTVGHTDMKTAPFFGLGIGLEHGRWLRFDVTGEYRGKWLFISQDINHVDEYTNEFTADIESWLGLFNAYIDMGVWCGVTPYIGGGIGMASVSVLGLKDVNVPNQGVAFGADNTEYNFAWALYAGMSYDVTDRFTLDLAYRYLDIGDAMSGEVNAYDGNPQGHYSGLAIRDITSHDLMFSARFALDRPAPYPVAIK